MSFKDENKNALYEALIKVSKEDNLKMIKPYLKYSGCKNNGIDMSDALLKGIYFEEIIKPNLNIIKEQQDIINEATIKLNEARKAIENALDNVLYEMSEEKAEAFLSNVNPTAIKAKTLEEKLEEAKNLKNNNPDKDDKDDPNKPKDPER